MPRSNRAMFADCRLFHVYCRGVNGATIFRDDDDRLLWVSLLARTVDRFSWTLWTYCLMSNHFHVVLEAGLDDVSRGMHRLNGTYAQRYNRRHKRRGHLFQDRFGLRAIDDETQLDNVCAYVRGNPVRAGLCDGPDDWPWSASAL